MNTDERLKFEMRPGISHAEPVLAVRNVLETVDHWHKVLGFPNSWTYGGNPPNHGGVSWNGCGFIQFGLNESLANVSAGHSVWVRARNLNAMYQLHQDNKAAIVSPLETKAWGFAEYTVKDINGYFIHFSAPASEPGQSEHGMPATVAIHRRKPSRVELQKLALTVGWAAAEDTPHDPPGITGAVAQDSITGEVIGCVLLLGDHEGFYYIKDLIVHPQWQRRSIGTALMQGVMNWLESNAPDNATVGLFTGDHLANFYRQFGFMQSCGMYKQILRQR
jgi:GNAT superfamily N-acetyltransferase